MTAQRAPQQLDLKYKAAGPVIRGFHNSLAFVRGIMGPIGSGKSVACTYEIMRRAFGQQAHHGRRCTRWAVIRNDEPTLKRTTLKTWKDWLPEAVAPIVYGSPITCTAELPCHDGTTVELEVFFVSMDRPEDVKKVLSMELTGAWLNEARELGQHVLDNVSGRVGRYPAKKDGGCTWSGVIMDTNPPDTDHWWYRLFEVLRPQGYELFRQPAALLDDSNSTMGMVDNPAAENIANVNGGFEYWRRLIPGKTPNWIKVYIRGEYGAVESGYPVYPEYRDTTHCSAEPIQPYPSLPLLIGMDFGLTPAAAICQLTPYGQLLVLDEVLTLIGTADEYGLDAGAGVKQGMGVRQFVYEFLKPFLFNKYLGMQAFIVGDPAGRIRSQTDERTCFDDIREAGFQAAPATTNAFDARRDVVAGYLTRVVGDQQPAFRLSPSCKVLRKGFIEGYKLHRVQVQGQDFYRSEPLKNLYSHVHDALQYACLGTAPSMITGVGASRLRSRPVARASMAAWI